MHQPEVGFDLRVEAPDRHAVGERDARRRPRVQVDRHPPVDPVVPEAGPDERLLQPVLVTVRAGGNFQRRLAPCPGEDLQSRAGVGKQARGDRSEGVVVEVGLQVGLHVGPFVVLVEGCAPGDDPLVLGEDHEPVTFEVDPRPGEVGHDLGEGDVVSADTAAALGSQEVAQLGGIGHSGRPTPVSGRESSRGGRGVCGGWHGALA